MIEFIYDFFFWMGVIFTGIFMLIGLFIFIMIFLNWIYRTYRRAFKMIEQVNLFRNNKQ